MINSFTIHDKMEINNDTFSQVVNNFYRATKCGPLVINPKDAVQDENMNFTPSFYLRGRNS